MDQERQPRHLLSSFDEALSGLRSDAMMMASLTERSLRRAWSGLFERDDSSCGMVIADDEEVDQLEVQIDEDGALVLVRFQPMAADLRSVIATMRCGVDLERVGDEAVTISRRARRLNRNPELPETRMLEPLFESVFSMLRDAIQSFADGDEALAADVQSRDKGVDRLEAEIAGRLIERLEGNPSRSRDYLELILIGRNLERVGDHAENIAEHGIYVVSGVEVRHRRKSS